MMLLSSCWCCPIVQFRDDDHCYTPFVQLQTCLKFLPVNGNTFNTPFEINTWIFKELLKKLVLSCCRGRSVRPCLPKSAERGAAIKVGSGGWSCRGREEPAGNASRATRRRRPSRWSPWRSRRRWAAGLLASVWRRFAVAEQPQVGGGGGRHSFAGGRRHGGWVVGLRSWAPAGPSGSKTNSPPWS